jgi:UDP-N-acetylmuramoyl-tripeptide--D-alanyl-D-alanine ligase
VGIDSRTVGSGELFVGLAGERADGGEYAKRALEAGAWGVLVKPEHADAITANAKDERADAKDEGPDGVRLKGAVLAHRNPLEGLQELARAWLKELRKDGVRVVGVTGSTGKTSTKDIVAALLSQQIKTVASPQNQNTEIGLPLVILAAPTGTEAIVLEMAMRGQGQIAELARIAEPEVGVIVNVGPVHLEQLGSIEGVAAAKAELIEGLKVGATAIVPADEPLLEKYRRKDIETVTFGPGGDVRLQERKEDGGVVIDDRGQEIVLKVSFRQAVNLQRNLPAAVAAARAIGVTPEGEVRVRFSKMRGERKELPGGGGVLIEDCYNANPMSMRAAIDDLMEGAQTDIGTTGTSASIDTTSTDDTTIGTDIDTRPRARARKVAVLGDMLELGAEERRYHREIGEYAAAKGVDVLIAVGGVAPEMAKGFAGEKHVVPDANAAAELLEALLRPGDTVLVKGSRGVELERVGQVLEGRQAKDRAHGSPTARVPTSPPSASSAPVQARTGGV